MRLHCAVLRTIFVGPLESAIMRLHCAVLRRIDHVLWENEAAKDLSYSMQL